jgi:hypothetical protein
MRSLGKWAGEFDVDKDSSQLTSKKTFPFSKSNVKRTSVVNCLLPNMPPTLTEAQTFLRRKRAPAVSF